MNTQDAAVTRGIKNDPLDATSKGGETINKHIGYIIASAKDASGEISTETRNTVEQLLTDLEHAYVVLDLWTEEGDNALIHAVKKLLAISIDSHAAVVNTRCEPRHNKSRGEQQ